MKETYWAIRHIKHDWFYNISTRRSSSIKEFVGTGLPYSWKQMYRAGYRAVKVKIEVVE